MQGEKFPGKSWLVKISHGVCVEESHGSAAKTITGVEERQVCGCDCEDRG